jgi:hypothetical protein
MNKILNGIKILKLYDNDVPHIVQIMGALGIFPGGGQKICLKLKFKALETIFA